MDKFIILTYQEGMEMLDTLAHAHAYLVGQYSDSMKRDQAQAHFDARALLLNRSFALLNEIELEYRYRRDEVETQEP